MAQSVLCAIAVAGVAATAEGQTPDFTGVERFWVVAESLQQGREPDAAQWDALFASPGYAALDAREKRRVALQLGIRAALHPALADEREKLLAGTSWTARVIRHVQQIPPRKTELERVRRTLLDNNFLQQASALAQTLLPDGAVARWGVPPVSFIFFLPDGRGYPDIIVADLANIAGRSEIVPFFAHELTHFYFAQLARARGLAPETPFEKAKLTLLTKLFEESLGDQHDKGAYLDLPDAEFNRVALDADRRAYLRDYRAAYATASQLAADLQRALHSQDANAVAALGRELPLEGRPLGFHMTRTIRKRLGDARLKAVVGDPLAWYAAFGEATRR
jgi:hypothetical protein